MAYGSLLDGVSTVDPQAIDESAKKTIWTVMNVPTPATGLSATVKAPDDLYSDIVGVQNGATLLPKTYWPIFSPSIPSICEMKSVGLAASGLSTMLSSARFVFPVMGQKVAVDRSEDCSICAWDWGQDWTVPLVATPWLKPILERLQYLRGLRPGWDSPRACPIQADSFDRLLRFLSLVMTPRTAPPSVVPLESGGLQAEWHRAGLDVEVEFDINSDSHIYLHELASGEEQESFDAVSVFVELELSHRLGAGYDPANVD